MATYSGTMNSYDSFSVASMDGTIDLDSDVLKVALFTSAYVPAATQAAYAGLSGEVANGSGYLTGGQALAGVTFTQTGGVAWLRANDSIWAVTGGSVTCRYYVIYSETATGNDLICWGLIDDGNSDVTIIDSFGLTLGWNASGIIEVRMQDA